MKKLLSIVWLCLWVIPASSQATRKPNVIIILMDDMGYGDTEPYGMTGIPTPNFNKLAKQGTRFTHFNAGQPICTASRTALLTGCYPNRVGMAGALLPTSKIALNPQETTIASMLKRAGYHTSMLGKWHLGNHPPYFPLHYGFDSFYGLPYSHDIWPRDKDGNKITDPANARYTWPELPLIEDDRIADTIKSHHDQELLTTKFTKRAVAYIRGHKNKPFFLYVAQPMPHVPLAVSDKFKGKSGMGIFGDVMMELDWSLGQILKTLDETGLAKNTIVIVASDNGPWLNYGDNAGSSGGFREGKATTFEGGTRVPLLMRWPGKIEAGGINSHLMTNMDILPTIAAATGAHLPQNRIDGLNFLPSLLAGNRTGPREVFYYYSGQNNLDAVRYKNWKLVLPHKSSSYQLLHGVNGNGGKILKIDVPLALYDLAHDPGEAYDVQQLHPDIMKHMQALADSAREDLGDDLTGRAGKNVRKAAVVE
ncbi:sulfatase [Mucilaginibacter mali]|uniref:Sulfatase n=1 Tax=Mucilaginibacter mali TaxID=2740462 RepID=A0A7D4TX54_9SPHI|nr:sulfatase [Mucilaginibacter mali]QKJ32055.1 sulfatase [Mucilaginibacter mali]